MYTRTQWVNNDTPVNAQNLNNIENGVQEALAKIPGTDALLNGEGVPSAGLGSDGDFYRDTLNLKDYGPKTSGAWGAGVSVVGPQGETGPQGATSTVPGPTGPTGSAATITTGTTSRVYDNSNPVINNSGSTSAAVIDFTLSQKPITPSEFAASYITPMIATINNNLVDFSGTENKIKIIGINTGTTTITLNHIPIEVKDTKGGKNWTICTMFDDSQTYDRETDHNNIHILKVVSVDYAKRQLIYASIGKNDDFTNSWKAGAEVFFSNPFANMSFPRTTPILKGGVVVDGLGTALQCHPQGMTKKNGEYGVITAMYKTSYTKANLRILIYYTVGQDFESIVSSSPDVVKTIADLEAALGHATLPVGHDRGAITYIRNSAVDKCEFLYETKAGAVDNTGYVYLFELDHDGVFSNIREYPCDYTGLESAGYISGCLYDDVNDEYVFAFLGVTSANYIIMRECQIISGTFKKTSDKFRHFIHEPIRIATYARAANVATIVTTSAHNFKSGEVVNIFNCESAGFNAYSGTITVTDATSFTFANTGTGVTTTASLTGEVNSPYDMTGLFGTGGNVTSCKYKGLLLVPYHGKQSTYNSGSYFTFQPDFLGYYDTNRKMMFDISKNPLTVNPVNVSSIYTDGVPATDTLYGLALGWSHNGMLQMFWDEETDELFLLVAHTTGDSTYNTCVQKFRFNV